MKATLFVTIALLALATARVHNSISLTDFAELGDPLSQLQDLFVGIWTEGGLQPPVNEINCFDETTANQTLVALNTILTQLSQSNYDGAIATGQAYVNSLPQSVQTCVTNDEETNAALQAYGLYGANPTKLEAKFLEYATLHHAAFQNSIDTALSDDNAEQLEDCGTDLGELVKTIMNS